jgi:hypothetical protein
MHAYDNAFLQRHMHVFDAVTQAIVEERLASPWLVDSDVLEVYRALVATMKTLSSGIYYETVPEGPVRLSLYRRLKAKIDELMQPNLEGALPALKVSDAVDVLEFLAFAASANSSPRPKSRQYLDWLLSMSGLPNPAEHSPRLIVP